MEFCHLAVVIGFLCRRTKSNRTTRNLDWGEIFTADFVVRLQLKVLNVDTSRNLAFSLKNWETKASVVCRRVSGF